MACPATTRSAGCCAALILEQFRTALQGFMAKFSEQCQGVMAIDGKALRRAFDRASGKAGLHMVGAWTCEQRLVLAQIPMDAKCNEITAVPKLPEIPSLKGTIVTSALRHAGVPPTKRQTVDALNGQVERIRERPPRPRPKPPIICSAR
jgi:hypothetical protein